MRSIPVIGLTNFVIGRIDFVTKKKILEKDIQNEILLYLKGDKTHIGRGGFWVNVHGGSTFMNAGLPDIIGCYNGRFIAFEVKRPGGKLTTLQAVFLDKIRAAGGVAEVVYSRENVIFTLNKIDQGIYDE